MYCKYCGKPNSNDSKYCKSCGKDLSKAHVTALSGNEAPRTHESTTKISDEDKQSLQKTYDNAGNSSIALSVISAVLGVIISLADPNGSEYLLGTIIAAFIIFAPIFYFGLKLKDVGVKNLQYSYKASIGLMIYLVVLIVISSIIKENIGWLTFILLYYYYKSYSETKKLIAN